MLCPSYVQTIQEMPCDSEAAKNNADAPLNGTQTMSLANISRRQASSLRCVAQLKSSQSSRKSSSSAAHAPKKPIQSHQRLPPAKMRALISLYHQSENWITPENLLERIDAAFVPVNTSYSLGLDAQDVTYGDLTTLASQMREDPKMAQLESSPNGRNLPGSYRPWSSNRQMSKRETKIFEALYGVEVERKSSEEVKVLPGLEVLDEMEEKLAKHREEDKETALRASVGDLANHICTLVSLGARPC